MLLEEVLGDERGGLLRLAGRHGRRRGRLRAQLALHELLERRAEALHLLADRAVDLVAQRLLVRGILRAQRERGERGEQSEDDEALHAGLLEGC
jgi:hypothetical protein